MIPAIKSKLVMMLHQVEDAPDSEMLLSRYSAMTAYIDGLADGELITMAQRGKLIVMAVKAFKEREYMLNLYDMEG